MTMQRDAAQVRILEDQFSTSVASVLRCALQYRRWAKNDPSTDLFGKFLGFCAAALEGRVDLLPELARRIVEVAPNYAVGYALRAVANAHLSASDRSNIEQPAPQEVARLRKMVYDDARIAEEMDQAIDSYYARAVVDDPSVGIAAREKLLRKSIELRRSASVRGMYAIAIDGRTLGPFSAIYPSSSRITISGTLYLCSVSSTMSDLLRALQLVDDCNRCRDRARCQRFGSSTPLTRLGATQVRPSTAIETNTSASNEPMTTTARARGVSVATMFTGRRRSPMIHVKLSGGGRFRSDGLSRRCAITMSLRSFLVASRKS